MTRELDMDGVSDGEPCDVPLVSYPALSSAECPHSAVLGEAQAYMSVPEFYPREGPHYAIMFDADEKGDEGANETLWRLSVAELPTPPPTVVM